MTGFRLSSGGMVDRARPLPLPLRVEASFTLYCTISMAAIFMSSREPSSRSDMWLRDGEGAYQIKCIW